MGSSRLKMPFSASCASSLPALSLANCSSAWSACSPSAILVSTSSASMGILLTWQTIGTLRRCSQVSTMDGGSLAPRNRSSRATLSLNSFRVHSARRSTLARSAAGTSVKYRMSAASPIVSRITRRPTLSTSNTTTNVGCAHSILATLSVAIVWAIICMIVLSRRCAQCITVW